MAYRILRNFIDKCIRQNDLFIPATIFFLIKNGGEGSAGQIARLLYIFDFKHEVEAYETIVRRFSTAVMKEYDIIEEPRPGYYRLKTWPLTQEQIEAVTKVCMHLSNGFFTNLEHSA